MRRSNHSLSSIFRAERIRVEHLSSFWTPAETINYYLYFGNRLGKQLSLALVRDFFPMVFLGTEQTCLLSETWDADISHSVYADQFASLRPLSYAYCEDMF